MAWKLIDIYKGLLKEQFPGVGMPMAPPITRPMGLGMGMPGGMAPSGPPQSESKNIVELPEVNTTISLFPMEKKLVFTPQEHKAFTEKLKLYVDVLHQNFMIDEVNTLDEGIFEVVFDPRENFQSVVQFLSPQSNV